MSYGRRTPNGSLPVFSVDTEKEAKDLIVMTCGTNVLGQYIARELVHEQTLENLYAFGARLADAYKFMKAKEPRKESNADPEGGAVDRARRVRRR